MIHSICIRALFFLKKWAISKRVWGYKVKKFLVNFHGLYCFVPSDTITQNDVIRAYFRHLPHVILFLVLTGIFTPRNFWICMGAFFFELPKIYYNLPFLFIPHTCPALLKYGLVNDLRKRVIRRKNGQKNSKVYPGSETF